MFYFFTLDALMAWSRSLIMSLTFSMPVDSLMSPSVMPTFSLMSAGIDACVMLAGWHTSDSTPPRLSASVISYSFSKNNLWSYSFVSSNDIITPPFFACLLFISYPGSSFSPG